jgi:hypothetical protein
MNRSGGRRRVKVRRHLQSVSNSNWADVSGSVMTGGLLVAFWSATGLNSPGWLHPRADSVDAGCRTSEHITQHAKFPASAASFPYPCNAAETRGCEKSNQAGLQKTTLRCCHSVGVCQTFDGIIEASRLPKRRTETLIEEPQHISDIETKHLPPNPGEPAGRCPCS